MARILAPNKEYAGLSAGISFMNGEGHTDDAYLISWFRSHGYTVEEESEKAKSDGGTFAPAQTEPKKKSTKRGK